MLKFLCFFERIMFLGCWPIGNFIITLKYFF